MEASSGNHCCLGKAISITYYKRERERDRERERECVCACVRGACVRVACYSTFKTHAPFILSSVAYLAIFFHCISQITGFSVKSTGHKKCVLIFSETHLILKRIQLYFTITENTHSRKVPVIFITF